MKIVLPHDIYDIIGCFAGDEKYRLVFTLTPTRKQLSTFIWIVERDVNQYRNGVSVGYRLCKENWVAVTMQDLLGECEFSVAELQSDWKYDLPPTLSTLRQKYATELMNFCTTIIHYKLCIVRPSGKLFQWPSKQLHAVTET